MNHWETPESVTNEAEIIHFGGKVYTELRSLTAGCLISDPLLLGGSMEPSRARPLGDSSLAKSSHGRSKGGRREEWRGVSAMGFFYVVCHSISNVLI